MSTLVYNVLFNVTGGGGENATLSLGLSGEQVGTGLLLQTQTIGTSSESIEFGNTLANLGGGLMVRNNDPTNYVEIDAATTFDKFPQKVPPGRAVLLGPQVTTLYFRANTAPVSISFLAAVL
jgi:hypothetical protein